MCIKTVFHEINWIFSVFSGKTLFQKKFYNVNGIRPTSSNHVYLWQVPQLKEQANEVLFKLSRGQGS